MEYLALTVLGKNQPGISNELTKLANYCECNIITCHMVILGNEFNANLLLSGSWNTLAKFESQLPALEQKHELQTLWQRTQPAEKQINTLPYTVYVIAMDNPEVIYQLTNFFAEQAITINELRTEIYTARYSDIPMCALSMSISVSDTDNISDLRERFLLFCDGFNFDSIIEPEKS
jgi:glycine cleavage system transcriptional repressor